MQTNNLFSNTDGLFHNKKNNQNHILLASSLIAQRFIKQGISIYHRAPRSEQRWQRHIINNKPWLFSQPITFTPYISTKTCSACCCFCSENLRNVELGQIASLLRPKETYFTDLERVLGELRGLAMSYSLSGLEATDNVPWLIQLIHVLDNPCNNSFIQQKVLYSNGNGFTGKDHQLLIQALKKFRLSWLELSRHHFDDKINQKIMRFKADKPVQDNEYFIKVVKNISTQIPMKLTCILQKNGIDNALKIKEYIKWASSFGIKTIIFRELSNIRGGYQQNNTLGYIQSNRVKVDDIVKECLLEIDLKKQLEPVYLTDGYYFWNIHFMYKRKLKIIFESSDYSVMHECHNRDRIYKLVYFANGQLCAGWRPDERVLMSTQNE